MTAIKNIILDTSEDELENLISPFIEEQFPSFVKSDYRKLVLFVKAYYEWMEQQGNPGYVLSKLDTIWDSDSNGEEFFSHFRNTYLSTFPDMLATNTSGNKPNKKTLLKKIRDFYGNKGTESAYKFLFRVLYDSDLELYYPKTDILRVSDGRWTEPRSIKTTSKNGSALFSAKNGQIVQYSGQDVVASAFVDGVVQYSFNGFPITEFFVTDINGDFLPDKPVRILKDDSSWEETAYSVLGQFFVETAGSNYRVGDSVTVTDPNGNGVGFSAKIDQIGLAGGIKKIGISNSGINYSADLIVNIFSESGQQTAKIYALRSAVTNYPGYFSGNRGKISSNKKVQDGHYYQEFSYELKSEVSFDIYFDVLRKIIHPAGMRMFGSILVKKSIDNTASSSSQAVFMEVPLIGRYTPYTTGTTVDLRNNGVTAAGFWLGSTGDLYPFGYNPYIGSTAQVGPNGKTAPQGSLFYDSGLGYTYTVAAELGRTCHNPIGAALGTTTAWLRNAENNFQPSMLRGLELWLKPENIVAASTTNGASLSSWQDSSPAANHVRLACWDRWNGLVSLHTTTTITDWGRGAYTTSPITRMSWKFSGICGGFTSGRLAIVGLHTSAAIAPGTGTQPAFAWYDYGFYGTGSSSTTLLPRQVFLRIGSNNIRTFDGTDDTEFSLEYKDPFINWYQDGVLRYAHRAGSGLTLYGYATFYSAQGTSVTVTELSNGTNPSGATFISYNPAQVTVTDYRGITVDRLLPQMMSAAYSGVGITGVSFNGGVLYSPLSTTSTGKTLGGLLQMGISYGNGSAPDKVLSGQHFYLTRPVRLTSDMDAFVVFRPTIEGASYGIGMVSTARPFYKEPVNDSVFFNRSYNSVDRTVALQNDENYVKTPSGRFLYPSGTPTGLVGFRPQGDKDTAQQDSIAYDPHVSGVCLGFAVGEWTRGTDNKIDTYLNGDRSTNSSLATGRRIASSNPEVYANSYVSSGLILDIDPKNQNTQAMRDMRAADGLRQYTKYWKCSPENYIGKFLVWKAIPALGTLTNSLPYSTISSTANDVVVSTDATPGLTATYYNSAALAFNGNATFVIDTPTTTNTVFLRKEDSAMTDASAEAYRWNLTFYIRKFNGIGSAAVPLALPSETPTVFLDTHNTDTVNIPVISSANTTITEVDTTQKWYRVSCSITGATKKQIGQVIAISNLVPGQRYLISAISLSTTGFPGTECQTIDNYSLLDALFSDASAQQHYSPQQYGTNEPSIVYRDDPWGRKSLVWRSDDRDEFRVYTPSGTAVDNYDGGWADTGYLSNVQIDPNKLYRFSVWARVPINDNGSFYFGNYAINASGVNAGVRNKSTGATGTNFYFGAWSNYQYFNNSPQWCLLVAHIHPRGSSLGGNHPYTGTYTVSGGGASASWGYPFTDCIWVDGTQRTILRSFVIGANSRKQDTQWFQPRIDEISGEDFPSVTALLENAPDRINGNSPDGTDVQLLNYTDVSTENGGVMVFNGTCSRAVTTRVYDYSGGNNTWEAWAYLQESVNTYNMFMGNSLPYFGFINGNGIIFSNDIAGVQRTITSTNAIVRPLRWYHLVFTTEYNATANTTTSRIYIDGLLHKSETFAGKQKASTRPLALGDGVQSTTTFSTQEQAWYPFKGKLGPVRIYDRTLSPQEIKQNYEAVRERYDEIG